MPKEYPFGKREYFTFLVNYKPHHVLRLEKVNDKLATIVRIVALGSDIVAVEDQYGNFDIVSYDAVCSFRDVTDASSDYPFKPFISKRYAEIRKLFKGDYSAETLRQDRESVEASSEQNGEQGEAEKAQG